MVYSFLQPGTYQVFVSGTNSGATINYKSNYAAPPTVTVAAGVFPSGSQALNVTMYKQ